MGADCIPLAYKYNKKTGRALLLFLAWPVLHEKPPKVEVAFTLLLHSYPMKPFNCLTQNNKDNNNSEEGGVLDAIGQTLVYPFSGKEGSTPSRHSAINRR